MELDRVRVLDALARKRFTYKAEPGDTWRSHADEVMLGKSWFGDCDDLGSTVLDLLTREGVALENLYRLIVSSTGGKIADHYAGCISVGNQFRIIGDTFRPDYPAAAMKHRGIFYNRLSENDPEPIWREGVPWKLKSGA